MFYDCNSDSLQNDVLILRGRKLGRKIALLHWQGELQAEHGGLCWLLGSCLLSLGEKPSS